MKYRFHGGPFEGLRTSQLVLGEWVVLYFDERQRRTPREGAFALVAYRQEANDGQLEYRFAHCLTPNLQKFRIEYADGPFKGSEASAWPMIWLPSEITRPLDAQARAIRSDPVALRCATYLAHYERRTFAQGHRYGLAKVTLASAAQNVSRAA